MSTHDGMTASTSAAAAATAQTRDEVPPAPGRRVDGRAASSAAAMFDIGPGVRRAITGRPYERRADDPIYRPLRIYALDPAMPNSDGAMALVNVPYEPLAPGPIGSVFKIDPQDEVARRTYQSADLDDAHLLIRNGRDPSPNDPLFHQQMTYAVASLVYAAFRSALGRHVAWGFDRNDDDGRTRLNIRPHAFDGPNAYYDRASGSLCFGYFRAPPRVAGNNLPGGLVFTCLSHDVIAHEVTHALLDGLRAHFDRGSGPDVGAFHEAFADLIAIFQHFSYDTVVRGAIRANRGRLDVESALTGLAQQLGQTTGKAAALRTVIDVGDNPALYDAGAEPHALGSVLASAVFEAFLTVYRRKTERYVRLATQGTGVLPPGYLSPDLESVLAEQASKLAGQFQAICIRAIDYCPPVDLEFGNFLRAMITADYDLVPDDPWHYREALVAAFGRRSIYPRAVQNLSEHVLRWRRPRGYVPPCPDLTFGRMQFDGDPGRPANSDELIRQAEAVGRMVCDPRYAEEFGIAFNGDPALAGDGVQRPEVQSVRTSRRVGPDGQVVFDLIAEVTQKRNVRSGAGAPFDFYGGATMIIGPDGDIRYVVSKNIASDERLERQRKHLARNPGAAPSELRCTHAPPAAASSGAAAS